MADTIHPDFFKASQGYHCDVQSRLDVVKKCEDPVLLKAALEADELQKTVRTAIERRLKALGTPSSSSAPADAEVSKLDTKKPGIVVPIEQITRDDRLQLRAEMCDDQISQIAEALKEGTHIEPIDVFYSDEHQYLLASGFHRHSGHLLAGKKQIAIRQHKGGFEEAFRFALSANAEHTALLRTSADKRKAAEAAVKQYPKASLRELADLCQVSHELIRQARKKVSTVDTTDPGTPSSSSAPADPQQDFFDDLNQTFKPVAEGWKTCINHSFFLRPDIPKKEKLNALDEFERQLADHRAQLKAARAKIEAQEES